MFLPKLMARYEKLLRWVLKGWRRYGSVRVLYSASFPVGDPTLLMRGNKSHLLPQRGDPNFIYVYLKLPVGTGCKLPTAFTPHLEKRVKVLENDCLPRRYRDIISNVAVSGQQSAGWQTEYPIERSLFR